MMNRISEKADGVVVMMQKLIFLVALVASSSVLVSSTEILTKLTQGGSKKNAPVCGRNEKYVENCSKTACACIDGHVRDNKGVCTPIEKCPPVCGKNEKYAENCSKTTACICINGYVRDNQGVCQPACGVNEEYSCCINGKCSGPRNCSEIGAPVRCVDIDPKKCIGGCICKKGYLRNGSGKCVLEEKCCDCRQHEIFSNCTNGRCFGARNCDEKGCPEKCYKIDPKDCIKGCICKKGYLRYKGVCIPEDKCPPKCTKQNEVLDECPGTCPARTCGIDDTLVKCGKPLEVGDSKCPPPACRCADGFYRNLKGDCVKWKECPQCSGPYEVYDICPIKCPPRECGVNKTLILCVVPPKYPDPKCEPGCRCADGYKRNILGRCIPQECCSKCTKSHEYYEPSPKSYPPKTCESIGKVYPCPKPLETSECKGECRCVPGYRRNKIGECISEEDYSKCTGPDEYFSCRGFCDNVCKNLSKQNQTNCHIQTFACNKKCYCVEGYARNAKNICVPFKDCEPECGENEEYSCCINGKCSGPRNCSEIGAPVRCVDIDPKKCIGGCICKKGYLRNSSGKCVLEEQCCECRKHEVYSNCTNGGCFGARNCDEKGCPEKCYKIDPKDCIKGCICKKEYLRYKGICVPENKCPPKCTKENEVLEECPGTCPARTCGIDDRLVKCGKPLEVGDSKCPPPACRCADGFFRTLQGECVKWKECPADCEAS